MIDQPAPFQRSRSDRAAALLGLLLAVLIALCGAGTSRMDLPSLGERSLLDG